MFAVAASVVILTIAMVLSFVFLPAHRTTAIPLETPFGAKSAPGGLVLADEVRSVLHSHPDLYSSGSSRHADGLAMQAAWQNQLAAYYMGIAVHRVHSLVWGSPGWSQLAAFCLPPGVDRPVDRSLGIKALAAAAIGGFGSLPGALLTG